MKWPDDYIPAGFTPYHIEDAGIIFNCDCRDILSYLPKVDLVLTDPLYGVTQNKWDDSKITLEVFDLIETPIVCTCQNPMTAELICRYKSRFKWSDIWEKSQATGFLNCKVMPLRKHEDIIVFCNGKMVFHPQIRGKSKDNIRPHGDTAASDNYGKFSNKRKRTIPLDQSYPQSIVKVNNSQNGYHPNEKPLGLLKYLVKSYSNKSHIILDPFLGSGTTAVAAKELGRRFIGIEISEEYCVIAVKRLRQGVFNFENREEK